MTLLENKYKSRVHHPNMQSCTRILIGASSWFKESVTIGVLSGVREATQKKTSSQKTSREVETLVVGR